MFAGIKSGYPPTEMRTNICSGTHHGHATSQGCVLNAHHVQPPSHQRGRAESGDGGAQQAEQRVDDAKELPVSLQAHERRRHRLSVYSKVANIILWWGVFEVLPNRFSCLL